MGKSEELQLEEARKLAEEHWAWLEVILLQQLQVQRRLFIDAMVHGIKHGRDKRSYGAVEKWKV